MRELKKVTLEEQHILSGSAQIEREIYMRQEDVIDAGKLLDAGKLIKVRKHTRNKQKKKQTQKKKKEK